MDHRQAPTLASGLAAHRADVDVAEVIGLEPMSWDDGDDPVGGRWNFDRDNREPPPKDGRAWPALSGFELDAIDLVP